MKLARWHYKQERSEPSNSAAVRPNGEQVDLYGHTSMATATIQVQQKQIAKLRNTMNQRCK